MHVYIYIYIYIHTYIHKYIHTYIHTHIYRERDVSSLMVAWRVVISDSPGSGKPNDRPKRAREDGRGFCMLGIGIEIRSGFRQPNDRCPTACQEFQDADK